MIRLESTQEPARRPSSIATGSRPSNTTQTGQPACQAYIRVLACLLQSFSGASEPPKVSTGRCPDANAKQRFLQITEAYEVHGSAQTRPEAKIAVAKMDPIGVWVCQLHVTAASTLVLHSADIDQSDRQHPFSADSASAMLS